MTRKELLQNKGYWTALIELTLINYDADVKELDESINEIWQHIKELIKILKEESAKDNT